MNYTLESTEGMYTLRLFDQSVLQRVLEVLNSAVTATVIAPVQTLQAAFQPPPAPAAAPVVVSRMKLKQLSPCIALSHKREPEILQAMKECGIRLTKLRESLNLSQRDIAKSVGVSHAAIAHYEQGRVRVTSVLQKRLANVFGVPVRTIFNYKGPKRYRHNFRPCKSKLLQISHMREQKGWTIVETASKLMVDAVAYREIEKRNGCPTEELRQRLANLFNLNLHRVSLISG